MKINDYLEKINSEAFQHLPEITRIPTYLYRHLTANAIAALSVRFNLPNDSHMQDWEYEVADTDRIDEFMDSYINGGLDDDEKFTLMETIIESFQGEEDLKTSKRWEKLLQIIEQNRAIHICTIHYWSLENYQEIIKNDEYGGIEDYELQAYFRVLWEMYKDEFIDKEKDEQIRQYKLSLNYATIKKKLEEKTQGKQPSSINHFNANRYLAFHNSIQLKDNFISELQSTQHEGMKSNIWMWVKHKYKITDDNYYNESKAYSKKAAEILGLPQSVITLFEELFGIIKKDSGEAIAIEKLIELCKSIQPGKDLSLFTPTYQSWLVKEYLMPKLAHIEYPIIKEIKAYATIIYELLQNYILGKFETIEAVMKIAALIRDWGYLIHEKQISIDGKNDIINSVLNSTLGLLNNISIFLNSGVNAADWGILIEPSLNDSSERVEIMILYTKIIKLLQT